MKSPIDRQDITGIAALTAPWGNSRVVTLFIRSLFIYTLFKVAVFASLVPDILGHEGFTVPTNPVAWVLFLPLRLVDVDVWIFLASVTLALLVSLVLRPNYITSILLCVLVYNLFRFALPVLNGSDQVLVVMSVWAIALPLYPQAKGERMRILQHTASNVSLIVIRIQVILIYWISGVDKLLSSVWRSGDAFAYIWHLEFKINPGLAHFGNPGLNWFLSWLTIVFELAFGITVWFKRTRLITLALGVLFHVCIGLMLNLLDFALIMILPYLCFLNDAEYDQLWRPFKRRPR